MDKPNRINRIFFGFNPLLYLIPVVIVFITHPQTPQTRPRSQDNEKEISVNITSLACRNPLFLFPEVS
jgi:hypothetical protein